MIAETLARIDALNHRNALDAVVELSADQLDWRPPRSNSVAFNLWHFARWADHLQFILSTMPPALRERIGAVPEVWRRDGLASRWSFPRKDLRNVQMGMEKDEDASAKLVLPPKEVLVSSARSAFGAPRMVRDEDLTRPADLDPARVPWLTSPSGYGTAGSWITNSIRHEARHPGMIEAVKGASGLRATATV